MNDVSVKVFSMAPIITHAKNLDLLFPDIIFTSYKHLSYNKSSQFFLLLRQEVGKRLLV